MNRFGKTAADVIGELHPLFRGLLFAAAARSDDEARPALTHISIEREGLEYRIVGTDGKRMHIHEFDPGLFDSDIEHLDPGLYEVIAKSAKFIVVALNEEAPKFPDWRRMLPGNEFEMHVDSMCARTTSKMAIVTKELLATDFAAEAIGFGCGRKKDDTAIIEYGSTGEGQPFLIKHDLGKALVMPMRFDHNEGEEPKTDADATPELDGFEVPPQPTGRVAKFVKSMQDTLGPGGSMELVNPSTGKGVKIAAGKVTPIHGKETPKDEQ